MAKTYKHAFTLVEIMVAISIFAIVALIVTDSFITADRVNKKAQAMKTVIDNLHFALNLISFNLQQGGTYHCIKNLNELPPISGLETFGNNGNNCPVDPNDLNSGGPAIIFRSPKSGVTKTIVYKLEDGKIKYWASDANMDDFAVMTVDNLQIDRLRFYVDNAENPLNPAMPRVFFTVAGQAIISQGLTTPFQLETVVSERI